MIDDATFQNALLLTVILSGIPLAVCAVVGLISGILQAGTQIQDQTLSFVPKIVATLLVFWVLGGWMSNELLTFTADTFDELVHH